MGIGILGNIKEAIGLRNGFTTTVKIRQENNTDYNAVYDIVKSAFATAEHSDGNEQDLVVALRKSEAFIPELSLIAETDGEIVGHIMFTRIKIGDKAALALAPLAVLPNRQRQGIGAALIHRGHEIAKDLSYSHIVVVGSEKYYPKFGYAPASEFGILPPFDVPNTNFMAICFDETVKISGTVEYTKEFCIEGR